MVKNAPALRVDHNPANCGGSYSTSGVVPIMFDHGKSAIPARTATPVEPHQAKASTGQGQRKNDSNDPFSDYIRRAKMTIRTLTFAGGGRNAAAAAAFSADAAAEHKEKKENTKDNHFSDFISRARMRIRTSSNLRRGKSTSVE